MIYKSKLIIYLFIFQEFRGICFQNDLDLIKEEYESLQLNSDIYLLTNFDEI